MVEILGPNGKFIQTKMSISYITDNLKWSTAKWAKNNIIFILAIFFSSSRRNDCYVEFDYCRIRVNISMRKRAANRSETNLIVIDNACMKCWSDKQWEPKLMDEEGKNAQKSPIILMDSPIKGLNIFEMGRIMWTHIKLS